MNDWGLSPQAARARLRQREWDNRSHLKQRLLGERPLPIVLSLRAPSARQALTDMEPLRQFVAAWQNWTGPGELEWQTRQFRHVGEQQLPTSLRLHTLDQLFQFLGADVLRDMHSLQTKLQPLLALDRALHPVLIQQLTSFDSLQTEQAEQLAMLLPQLQQGLGRGCYLRALPVQGIDTKFIESHHKLIERLLDALHHGALADAGGLLAWLNCIDNPRGWLLVRPLCSNTQRALAGLSLLQIDSATLRQHALPGTRVLVVENMQSGLALPNLANTVAICGGGKNLNWMHNDWMRHRMLAYWGDIDSHGLGMLEQALIAQPHTQPLMMDRQTFAQFASARNQDSKPLQQALYQQLLREPQKHNRLEQEMISPDVVLAALKHWTGKH